MPIPKLTSDGLLPPGEYECTMEEIASVFGEMPDREHRQALCRELGRLIDEVKLMDFTIELIVNGSFTTTKERPKDIDIFLAFRQNTHEPSAFRLLRVIVDPRDPTGRRHIMVGYPNVDFYGGIRNETRCRRITNTYRRLREDDKKVKGFLKVRL